MLARSGLTSARRRLRGRALVVTFHRVLPDERRCESAIPSLAVTPDELRWHLEFLHGRFRCSTLVELARDVAAGDCGEEPRVAVTFDDGTHDNFEFAREVLQRVGVPATFFVVAERMRRESLLWHDRLIYAVRALGDRPEQLAAVCEIVGLEQNRDGVDGCGAEAVAATALVALQAREAGAVEECVSRVADLAESSGVPRWEGMMDVEEIRSLRADGHEIGLHSATHAMLPQCGDAQLRHETAGARSIAERELGFALETFCYPNGQHDDRVIDAVRRAGLHLGVTTRWGSNDASTPAFQWRRCDVQSATSRDRRGRLSAARLAWRLSGFHPKVG